MIEKLWQKECLEVVGPMIGRASDGYNRHRILMLQDYKVQTGRRLKIDWLGFFFTCGLDGEGNASGMHDYIRNNKKTCESSTHGQPHPSFG